MNMRKIEIFDVPLQPQRQRARIFQRLAPLPGKENGRRVLIYDLLAQRDGKLSTPIGVGCGDQYLNSLALQGAAHCEDGLAWAAVAQRYGRYDVQNFQRGRIPCTEGYIEHCT